MLPSLHIFYIKCTGYMRTLLFWVITQQEVVIGFPETSVRNYHYSVCSSPEEHSCHLCCGRLKLCILGVWLITKPNYFSDIYKSLGKCLSLIKTLKVFIYKIKNWVKCSLYTHAQSLTTFLMGWGGTFLSVLEPLYLLWVFNVMFVTKLKYSVCSVMNF